MLFQGITIVSSEAIANAKRLNWPVTSEDGLLVVKAPGGYKFYLIDRPQPTNAGSRLLLDTYPSSNIKGVCPPSRSCSEGGHWSF